MNRRDLLKGLAGLPLIGFTNFAFGNTNVVIPWKTIRLFSETGYKKLDNNVSIKWNKNSVLLKYLPNCSYDQQKNQKNWWTTNLDCYKCRFHRTIELIVPLFHTDNMEKEIDIITEYCESHPEGKIEYAYIFIAHDKKIGLVIIPENQQHTQGIIR